MYLLFTCMPIRCAEFYESGPRVRRLRMKWFAIAECLRNTDQGGDWRMILKCILGNYGWSVWFGLIWLRLGTSGGLLLTLQ
jgi:hypothetical protein